MNKMQEQDRMKEDRMIEAMQEIILEMKRLNNNMENMQNVITSSSRNMTDELEYKLGDIHGSLIQLNSNVLNGGK